MIPYGRQEVVDADVEAVVAVLRSDFLTQGPAVPRFEAAIAAYCGVGHVVAVNSATAALHIACAALGLGPGDRLWTSPITFVASANCALYCGAEVDFVDVDPETANLCPRALETKLREARRAGQLPKIVVPVHLTGEPCDMDAIWALADEYGFSVVEDASHAIGAWRAGNPVGRGRSAAVVFSFHPVKIVTTGEGGAVVTNDPELARRLALLRSHGITRDPAFMTQAPDGPWYYQQVDLGFNYRMTDLQAALGASQMTRLDGYVERRHALARRYDQLLADLPVRALHRDAANRSALHLYVVRVAGGAAGPTRAAVFDGMRARGIGVNVHYIPVPSQPYYRARGFDPAQYPHAQAYYAEAISLPLYPGLTEAQQDAVVLALRQALGA
jgi:UDP-4-amino-4,6-dideoxy-N-acetyl-beta-L-altrosamine transaminase